MKTIAQGESGQAPDGKDTQFVQVVLPVKLARRAKATAAENGWSLKQLVQTALEQYLGMGKAA